MHLRSIHLLASSAVLVTAASASAQTAPYFVPLTQSAPVVAPNAVEELNAPWVAPAGISQTNLTSMDEIEGDPSQSVGSAPNAGTSRSMWDMSAFDPTGRFVFIPHESPWSAGLSRYDRELDESTLLWAGDGQGASEIWTNDYGAFDPATFTPNCTVLAGEEWTAEGRIIETLNPFAAKDDIQIRELDSIANTAHEGLRFSADAGTLYFVDEWNSGSIYKLVLTDPSDLSAGGQTFVLVVDAFAGDAAANYNEAVNVGQPRTGAATWVPITDASGNALTTADPFMNGPTTDPRTDPTARGGRPAADEVNGTPYGRPEDMEMGRLANGNEVMFFAATSETTVYSVEMLPGNTATVRVFASGGTPKNVGFPGTTGTLGSPDNLATDPLGNVYIIEDAPNGSSTGGDVWFVRDVDDNGEGESLDHFLSIRVDGSEATGMEWSPVKPFEFVINVQHPDSADLDAVPGGFGDALWLFDVSGAPEKPLLRQMRQTAKEQRQASVELRRKCRKAMRQQMRD